MSVFGGILSEPWAQRLGWVLLHSLWQGAFIGALFGLLRASCRDRSPQVRYRIGSAALLALAILSVLTFFWLSGSTDDSGSTYSGWLTAGSTGVASSGIRHLGSAFLGLTPLPDPFHSYCPGPARAPPAGCLAGGGRSLLAQVDPKLLVDTQTATPRRRPARPRTDWAP
jgi:hypothetical protein